MNQKPRKNISKEVLCILRKTKRPMEIEEIAKKTKLTRRQVRKAISSALKPRGMVKTYPREKLTPGKGQPPLGRMKVEMLRDKNGKIPKRIDWITSKYKEYKQLNGLW